MNFSIIAASGRGLGQNNGQPPVPAPGPPVIFPPEPDDPRGIPGLTDEQIRRMDAMIAAERARCARCSSGCHPILYVAAAIGALAVLAVLLPNGS